MKFEEKNAELLDETYIGNCIYFLIRDSIVVYVGKTSRGFERIIQHKYDKNYDYIYIIKCEKNELLKLEDYFMIKYKPEYNILYNSFRKNIISVYNELRKISDITIIDLIDFIKENNIKIERFKTVETINQIDYYTIKEHFVCGK